MNTVLLSPQMILQLVMSPTTILISLGEPSEEAQVSERWKVKQMCWALYQEYQVNVSVRMARGKLFEAPK